MPKKYWFIIRATLIISGVCLVLVILIQAQNTEIKTKDRAEKAANQNRSKKDLPKKDEAQKPKAISPIANEKSGTIEENPEENKKRLVLQVRQTIEGAISQSKELQNQVVKLKIRAIAADSIWDYQEEKARRMLIEDFHSIPSINDPQQEASKSPTYKKRKLGEVKETLRKELMTIISSHDSVLTQSLLVAEKSDQSQTDKDKELITTGEMLGTAMDLAATNPETASRIIKDSLKTGINPRFALSLMSLRQSDPVAASAIFNEVFSRIRTSGDLWEFQKLAPYVLPTELDRFYGINYLSDERRAKDAKSFTEYGAILLAQQLASPQVNANSFPEMIMRETHLWRSLIPLFNDLAPEKTGMVQARLNQLSALQPGASGRQDREDAVPPTDEERVKKSLAAAESSSGARKDALLSSAAFAAMRMEDFDQAISLIERVENQEQREIDGAFILNIASAKALNKKEDINKALALARGIQWPGTRVAAFSRIYAALRTAKKQDQASEVLDELRTWLDSRDNTSDKVWGWLIYLDHFAKEDSEKAFAVLSSFVGTLNKADLAPPAKPLTNRNYWYPEFHDFRKSLGLLARTDFERALQEVQLVKDREALLLIQVALCNEYLKADKQKPAPKVSQEKQP